MTLEAASNQAGEERWRFLRDVIVFQAKMLVSNVRDIALMPVSLCAAFIDLLVKGEREGALFYRVLRWGAHSDAMIGVYSAVMPHEASASGVDPRFTIDAVVAQLETAVVRECQKGGTAASIKAAMDRAIDQMHQGTSRPAEQATRLFKGTAAKLRLTSDTERRGDDHRRG
jgi:hypothetical protein